MINFCQNCGGTNDTHNLVCPGCLNKPGTFRKMSLRYCTDCGEPIIDITKHQCHKHEMRDFWTSTTKKF